MKRERGQNDAAVACKPWLGDHHLQEAEDAKTKHNKNDLGFDAGGNLIIASNPAKISMSALKNQGQQSAARRLVSS